jgi:hypothetical protein
MISNSQGANWTGLIKTEVKDAAAAGLRWMRPIR